MAGTVEGGKLTAEVNKARHGKDYYNRIGKIGGSKKGVKKGFAAMSPEKRRAAGKKGGEISRL